MGREYGNHCGLQAGDPTRILSRIEARQAHQPRKDQSADQNSDAVSSRPRQGD